MSKNYSEPIFLTETQSYDARHRAENHKPIARQESALFPCPSERTHLANQQNMNPVLVGGSLAVPEIERYSDSR